MLMSHPKISAPLFILLGSIFITACQPPAEEPEVVETTPLVNVKPLAELLIDYEFKRPARVISLNDSLLSAELSAPIAKIYAQVGDSVTRNAPLVELNCRDEQTRLQQAKAQTAANDASATLSKLNFERGKRLFAQQNISEQEMNRLESDYARNQANQALAAAAQSLAEDNVSKCVIRAPFNAVVTERAATLGQFSTPGAPMIRLLDSDNLEVSAFLVNEEAESIQQSQNVVFVHENTRYNITARAITPAIDSVRRTRETRWLFTAETPLPGSAGEIVWQHPFPVLPAEYLSKRNNQLGLLYTDTQANTSTTKFIALPDAREGQPTPVRYGGVLNANTAIITDGRFGLDVDSEININTATN